MRLGRRLRKHWSGGHDNGIRRYAVKGVVFALLCLASYTTAAAEDEGAATPLPTADVPTTTPAETEEEEEEANSRARPFLAREDPLTETLLPDASTDLRSFSLFPPNALEGLRGPERLLQVGKFAISPSVEAAATYDDNVDATDNDREDDVTGNLRGSVRAASLFERHSLGFEASAAIEDPHQNPGNTNTDKITVATRADGQLDLTRRSSLTAEVAFERGAQDPEAQEAGARDEPVISTAAGAMAYTQRFERLSWQLGGGIERREAGDGDEAAEQDRTSYTVSPSTEYHLGKRLSVFAESDYTVDSYDVASEGGRRDSQEIQALVGTALQPGRAFSARIGVGYTGVFFEDSERDDRHEPTFVADLNGAINLDRLTLLKLGLNHSTDSTTANDAALVTRTKLFASVNRSLSSASAILASVGSTRADFVDDDRTDHDVVASLAYSHSLFRNIALNVAYRYSKRFSNRDEEEFFRNLVSVGLYASF